MKKKLLLVISIVLLVSLLTFTTVFAGSASTTGSISSITITISAYCYSTCAHGSTYFNTSNLASLYNKLTYQYIDNTSGTIVTIYATGYGGVLEATTYRSLPSGDTRSYRSNSYGTVSYGGSSFASTTGWAYS